MTVAVTSKVRPEVPWTRPELPLMVGKDILELLSSSMYVDPMAMYREYVQNSADAIDLARARGALHTAGVVRIRIDPVARNIWIRDNGAGLSETDFAQRLIALGGSKKRGTQARGFQIGRAHV